MVYLPILLYFSSGAKAKHACDVRSDGTSFLKLEAETRLALILLNVSSVTASQECDPCS